VQTAGSLCAGMMQSNSSPMLQQIINASTNVNMIPATCMLEEMQQP